LIWSGTTERKDLKPEEIRFDKTGYYQGNKRFFHKNLSGWHHSVRSNAVPITYIFAVFMSPQPDLHIITYFCLIK
jgi:hypothetical protein